MNPNLANILLIAILAAVVGLPSYYIYKTKKAGAACIGCPYAKQCGKKSSGCGCGCKSDTNKNSGGGC